MCHPNLFLFSCGIPSQDPESVSRLAFLLRTLAIGLGSTVTELDYICQDPLSKYGHIHTDCIRT